MSTFAWETSGRRTSGATSWPSPLRCGKTCSSSRRRRWGARRSAQMTCSTSFGPFPPECGPRSSPPSCWPVYASGSSRGASRGAPSYSAMTATSCTPLRGWRSACGWPCSGTCALGKLPMSPAGALAWCSLALRSSSTSRSPPTRPTSPSSSSRAARRSGSSARSRTSSEAARGSASSSRSQASSARPRASTWCPMTTTSQASKASTTRIARRRRLGRRSTRSTLRGARAAATCASMRATRTSGRAPAPTRTHPRALSRRSRTGCGWASRRVSAPLLG
mmetsp:Transcript_10850/g.26874  ORF Transcript_10850/g.26874 Transcript_10850/m.26874 type:complete len:278 (-) Transcript_10850:755-1588(-)